MLIFLLTWNNAPNATFRVRHIAYITRNDVHVTVKNALARGLADVDTHVVTVRMETLINFLLHILQHDVHGLALMVRQIKVGGDVPLGGDKRMTGRDRIAIVEGHAGSRLADDFHSAGQAAERTLLAFHARQLVEMVVLIEFVAFVGDKTLVRQLYITLVCILLVDGMESEALFCQVTTHGKIGRSLWGKQVGDIHQHLGLSVWFQDVQHIVAEDGVEFTLRKIRAVVVIVADNIKALFLEFVCIETKSASKIEYFTLQQIVLYEVSRRHREIRALDGREVGMVYLLWFHSYWGLRVRNPILTAIWLRGEKVLRHTSRNCSSDICIKSCGEQPKA